MPTPPARLSTKSNAIFFKVNLFPNSIMKLLPEATIIVAYALLAVKHEAVRSGSVLSEHNKGSIVISAFEDHMSLFKTGLYYLFLFLRTKCSPVVNLILIYKRDGL